MGPNGTNSLDGFDRPAERVNEVSSFFPIPSPFFRFISVNNVRVQIASYGTLIGSRHDIPSVFSVTPRVTHLRLGFSVQCKFCLTFKSRSVRVRARNRLIL